MSTDEFKALESDGNEIPDQKPARSGLLAGFALLLALGALALSALVWLEAHDGGPQENAEAQAELEQLRQTQSDHSRNLANLTGRVESLLADSSPDVLDALQSTIEEHAAQNLELQSALETQQLYTRTLQQAIEALQARLKVVETGMATRSPAYSSSPEQFNLAGVEYLLRLAPERLTLFHDVRAADAALAAADVQLAAMDNPVYLGLRQHIADARQALADAELPNQIELSARLDGIQKQLSALTFGGESNAQGNAEAAASAAEDQGWWQRLKSSLASLVTVRRSSDKADSRLTLEDKDLLRQGLWMQIEGARLALMRHDQASWEDTLSRARDVLDRWFDPSSGEYSAVNGELQSLLAVSVSPKLPDISGPWAQLQLISSVSPPAAQPVAEPAEVAVTVDEEPEVVEEDSDLAPVEENSGTEPDPETETDPGADEVEGTQ